MITPAPGVVIAGRYALVRVLARGGMGSVWVARCRELDVDVTVKFMAPPLVASADARVRFEREAKAAARLRSQHVVQVLGYGVEDETPYMAMELLNGESLWDRVSREGRLPVPITARILVQICKALRTAHEAGLVHRDLKPGNIFLAIKDGEEVVTVLDFGIAKTADLGDAEAHTESGVLLGSAHYMSPEQIRSSRVVDHRSDLWSVGVILYRMLTGRLPFPGQKLGDVLVSVCTEPFPPLSSISPDLPAWLDGFFARALARDPDQRFKAAVEMAEAFSGMALGAAPRSTPPPATPPPAASPPAPQQATSPPATSPANPRWRATVQMPHSPLAALPAQPAPAPPAQTAPAPSAPPPPAQWSPPVAVPAIAVQPQREAPTATAVVFDPRREPLTASPSQGEARAPKRSLLPVWIAAAVLVLAGIGAVAIRFGSSARTPAAESATATVAATAAPAPEPPPAEIATAPSAAPPPASASAAEPRVGAPPPAVKRPPNPARTAPPRSSKNPLDRSD